MKYRETWIRESEAYRVIHAMGGVQEVAELLQLNPSSVTRWMYPHPYGRGGTIPPVAKGKLAKIARALDRNIPDLEKVAA